MVIYVTKFLYMISLCIQYVIPVNRKIVSNKKLVIEAGENGWNSIFLNELFLTAMENNRFDQVSKLVISKKKNYIIQNLRMIRHDPPSFFVFDIRTLSDNHLKKIFQALYLVAIFKRYAIFPLSILTDPSLRLNRILTIFITSNLGKIITFIDYSSVKEFFYKSNVAGPVLPPYSLQTRKYLDSLNQKSYETGYPEKLKVGFVGDLYQSRMIFFKEFSEKLIQRELNVEFIYLPKDQSLDINAYWKNLLQFDFILTTTHQGININKLRNTSKIQSDFTEINQVVFRVTEALLSNRVLLCEKAPGLDKFFNENSELIVFTSTDDLISKLVDISENLERFHKIRAAGFKKISAFMDNDIFWCHIDC